LRFFGYELLNKIFIHLGYTQLFFFGVQLVFSQIIFAPAKFRVLQNAHEKSELTPFSFPA